jgi:CPA2 family monovalent cation:H+ antiporter-2
MLLAFAPAIGGLLALVAFGRLVLRPLMRSVAGAANEEFFVAASLLVVVGAGLAASVAGISMGLGALVAGLLLAETEHRTRIERTVEPFKGLLLGLFFVSVGSGLDISVAWANPAGVICIVGVMILNAVTLFALARLFGLTWASSAETALMLAVSGEFAFLIVQTAMQDNLLAHAIGETVLVPSTLSMFSIPLLSGLAAAIRRRIVVPFART